MRVTIVTDQAGRVTGLARSTGPESEEAPSEVVIIPAPGQLVYEVELPPELERVESPMELYAALERHYAMDPRTTTLTRTTPQSVD